MVLRICGFAVRCVDILHEHMRSIDTIRVCIILTLIYIIISEDLIFMEVILLLL